MMMLQIPLCRQESSLRTLVPAGSISTKAELPSWKSTEIVPQQYGDFYQADEELRINVLLSKVNLPCTVRANRAMAS
jgi:hypothetical protein